MFLGLTAFIYNHCHVILSHTTFCLIVSCQGIYSKLPYKHCMPYFGYICTPVIRGGDPGGDGGGHVPPSIFLGGDRPPLEI